MTRKEAVWRIREHKQIHARKEPRAVAISTALEMGINSLTAWDEIERDIEFEISIQGNKDIKQGLRNALGYIKKHSALLPEQRPCNKCKHHKDTGCEVWECDPEFIEAYGGNK